MLKQLSITSLFIVLVQFIGFGQSSKQYNEDTSYINKCINLASSYLYIQPDTAQLYLDTAFNLSTKINYEYGLFKATNMHGIVCWASNNLDSALYKFKTALLYANTEKYPRSKAKILGNIALIMSSSFQNDSARFYLKETIRYCENKNIDDLKAKAYFDLSNLHIQMDNYGEAAKALNQVNSELKRNPDSILLLLTYQTFGLLYYKIGMFDSSITNYKRAIELDLNIKEVSFVSNTYNNIGELYFYVAKNYDSALLYYQESVSNALPYKKSEMQLVTQINTGNVYTKLSKPDSAIIYYRLALSNPLLSKFPDYEAALFINIGLNLIQQKKYQRAHTYLTTGLKKADSLKLLLYKKNALQSLYQLDSLEGNYKKSLLYYQKFHSASESLNLLKAKNELAVIEYKKYLEQEKLNNKELIKQNSIKNLMLWLSVFVTIVLLVLIFTLIKNQKKVKSLLKTLSLSHNELKQLHKQLKTTNEELHAQQNELKKLSTSKDKFFSILGHDLKSPFNSLIGLLDLLDHEWESIEDTERKSIISMLHTSSKKTFNLLNDILNWGKTQTGHIVYEPEKIRICTVADNIVELLGAQLRAKEQKLVLNIPAEIEVISDIHLFTQIIQNFVNNAIKYTHNKGIVTITAHQKNGKTNICVSDNGIGIPMEKLPTMFDLDSDFNRPGTANEESTGMGLILSKEYARIINAELTVTSTKDEGSTFCLILQKT